MMSMRHHEIDHILRHSAASVRKIAGEPVLVLSATHEGRSLRRRFQATPVV